MASSPTAQHQNGIHDAVSVDWNDVWNHSLTRHWRSQYKSACCPRFYSYADARRYWNSALTSHQGRLAQVLSHLDIGPQSRILDIGSGPGVLAIPLAGRSAHVTAVDPSSGMLSLLRQKAAEADTGNIACVEKRWEDVHPERDIFPPYHAAIASLSLSMLNIRECLRKMNEVVSGSIHLYWFAGEPVWERHRRFLFSRLYNLEYQPMPKSDILYQVLYQMGIYPHMRVFSYTHLDRYASLEEALQDYMQVYPVAGFHQEQELRQFLQTKLHAGGNGLVLPSSAHCVHLWWDTAKRPD